ncbi:M48 family metalloprotease [Nocardia sp. NPDC127526]|uniref:M48 family metalloprotease n=1 Tax=Nocardia sp. NPDC127526 TaxID=3345393 RepID=UPI003627B002
MPSIVLAGMLVAHVGGLLGVWGMVGFVGLWGISGVPVFLFGMALESRPEGVAVPEWPEGQAKRLQPAWRDVVEAAGVSESDYVVLIEKSSEVKGSAGFGHLINVSSRAVRRLKRRQLSALLAHELGHLLSSRRSGWSLVAMWYSVPLYLAPTLLAGMLAVSSGFANDGPERKWSNGIGQVTYLATMGGMLVALFGTRFAIVAAGLLIVRVLARRMVSRRDERMADLVAVDLGFGDGLLALLRKHLHDSCPGPAALPWRDRLSRFVFAPLSTHPTADQRIRAVEARMRARMQDEQDRMATGYGWWRSSQTVGPPPGSATVVVTSKPSRP